ncbi:MAG: YifB family Mg chelatase-like AAA ATPase [Mariprofundaceae bacterium]|nr:YifB family Mg chelatase-like AAA ATPase [Mariprofundaceae bacterium]
MPVARLVSAALRGLDAEVVALEVDLSRGLPGWSMVGLPDAAVRESRDRVRAALLNSGFDFPLNYITVNLAPADIRKDGAYFDLPVAIGILLASNQLKVEDKSLPFLLGEMALDGRLNRVRGILPLVQFAQREGFSAVIVPSENADEAAQVEDINVFSAASLLDVHQHLAASNLMQPHCVQSLPQLATTGPDMMDVRGQANARRAMEIAAAGAHHLLMSGSPGVGKSMLAARMPSILPVLSKRDRLDVARIYSVAAEPRSPLLHTPPFRAPHHSASDVALIGGGSIPRPGEVSKAHCGVLFLDELPEYKRQVLEVLRQPLETGEVCIARAADTLTFPARFQLIAAMNPCPCGYLGHPTRCCRCSDVQVRRYQSRISGPLLDRFDLRIDMPPVEQSALLNMEAGESSASIALRVKACRARQLERQGVCNAALTPSLLEKHGTPDAAGLKLLQQALQHFDLSARSYHRLLKVALTIADLQQVLVQKSHIAEALQYRGQQLDGSH